MKGMFDIFNKEFFERKANETNTVEIMKRQPLSRCLFWFRCHVTLTRGTVKILEERRNVTYLNLSEIGTCFHHSYPHDEFLKVAILFHKPWKNY